MKNTILHQKKNYPANKVLYIHSIEIWNIDLAEFSDYKIGRVIKELDMYAIKLITYMLYK